uniref:UDP-glucuronosyltransferase n=1 Tax=Meloidogyne enterolobii TaxID=390850 RepID=A0A6V7VSR1_MELEN|nr:unnamed protein product [Meloidogyne enterolobii]
MLRVFKKYTKICKFEIKLKENELTKKYSKEENIKFIQGFVEQQDILAKENTKLFISHCGQNSLNEAMYAGVPLICIPFDNDQFYLSSLAEYLGIGIYVKNDENFGNKFEEALKKFLNINKTNIRKIVKSKYRNKAIEMRKDILSIFKNEPLEKKFVSKIFEIVNVDEN